MSLSRKCRIALVLACLIFSSGASAYGQSDSEKALEAARIAFDGGQFEQARDLLVTAAQTDAKNPDIHLLLGKAHYQLGEVGAAMAAWRTTLKIAPQQAYAKRMVEVLSGQSLDVDTHLRVVTGLLNDRMYKPIPVEIARIRSKALTDEQSTTLLMLESEYHLGVAKPQSALRSLGELAVRFPGQQKAPKAQFLLAQARVAVGGEQLVSGLAILETIAQEQTDSPLGPAAELELIAFRLRQETVGISELLTWIENNKEHPLRIRARNELVLSIGRLLSDKTQVLPLQEDSGLTANDQQALAASKTAFSALTTAEDASALTARLIKHLESFYVAAKAFAAASSGLDALEEIQMPPSSAQLVGAARRRLDNQISTAQFNEIVALLAKVQDETGALNDWIEKHPDHKQIPAARQALLNWYLAATLREKKPIESSPVSASDTAAFQVAATILEDSKVIATSVKLVERLNAHIQARYVANGALSAATAAYENLLTNDLPVTGHVKLLHGLAAVQTKIALTTLNKESREQRIVAGELPDELKAVLATLDTINTLVPATQSWKQQAALAIELDKFSPSIAWPTLPNSPKPTQTWAVEIALPVIADRSDAEAVKSATVLVNGIVDQLAALPQPSADQLAISLHNKLLENTPEDDNAWVDAMLKRADLQTALANRIFVRNTQAGLRDNNKSLSETQKQLVATLKTLVASRPSQAVAAIGKLDLAMRQHVAKGHFQATEEAYTLLQSDLPASQQHDVELAMIRMSIQQIKDRDARAIAQGYRVKTELDPQMEKSLVRLYEIQRGIPDNDPRIASARQIANSIVNHYRELDMFAVAEKAIGTKAENAVPVADKYAEFQLADLTLFLAQREQARLLMTFRGREKIAFTPAFESAQTAYESFITKYPSDALARQAVERLFGIGQLFESHQRGQLAANVFSDIETFAATIKQLGQADIGTPTTAERASLAAAIALHNDASRAFVEQLKKQPAGTDPPDAITEEFAKAIEAYRAVIINSPEGPLVDDAIGRILAIGFQFAKSGAWDAADVVYEGFLAQQLPLRNPERIEFARALCQVGKVMPAHAEKMLSALSHAASPAVDDKQKTGYAEEKPTQLAMGGLGSGIKKEKLPQFEDKYRAQLGIRGDVSDVLAAQLEGNLGANALAANEKFADADKSESRRGIGDAAVGKTAPVITAEELAKAEGDAQLLASVSKRQAQIAQQLARIDDRAIQFKNAQPRTNGPIQLASTVLSDSEIARQAKLLDTAYTMLQDLRERYPTTPTAKQARGEIAVLVEHWRGLSMWERSAKMATQFLTDNPTDHEFPTIRQDIARDYLSWAAQGVKKNGTKQAMLDTVISRFDKARTELTSIVTDFPADNALRQQAQWDIANSFLTQARVVATLSPTLARGQFVRSANELMKVAERYHDHPQIGTIPQMLANIASELAKRTYHDEAISVWTLLSINYPMHKQGQTAALQIAQTYQTQKQPLRAVEAYVELNFARGGNDQAMQNAIYQIATSLKAQKRWVEALHVLESFVDSFPHHAQAGQALTMIGQIHQTNEVWEDALAAYDRVITEYAQCEWVKQARWSIAECTINLSRWNEAIDHYRKFSSAYGEDPQTAIAAQRIEILKDLDRFQGVVDEEGQRKSFDAQYQIAEMVRKKLSNPVKAIIEYRKVATRWPQSHLADDALFQIGTIFLAQGETEKAREALLAAAEDYPSSPLADDALFLVGQSFENEAQSIAAVTRDTSAKDANDQAQRFAYKKSQALRLESRGRQQSLVSKLKQEGNFEKADEQVAINAVLNKSFDYANAQVISQWASQEAQALSAAQLADRQDKVNAALRKAVASFRRAATLVSGDKADDALLRMAQIYDERLKDADKAMDTWLEIVKQFSGTSVAENASWKIAQYYEQHSEYAKAIDAYQSFLRNYRRSPKANIAQAAIAENYEHLGKWVEAMDAYSNYLTNFPDGPRLNQAKQQINWIKTYRL